MKSLGYMFYDKSEATEIVARLLQPPRDRERLIWPDKYRPTSAPTGTGVGSALSAD